MRNSPYQCSLLVRQRSGLSVPDYPASYPQGAEGLKAKLDRILHNWLSLEGFLSITHSVGGDSREANFSAQHLEARAHPWIPVPDGPENWPQGAERAAREGAGPVDSLNTAFRELGRSEGFARRARLLRPAEFRRVFARGIRCHAGSLVLIVMQNDIHWARLGMAISKRCAPCAIDRNRLKRICREVFRLRSRSLGNFDCVVVCKRTAVSESNEVVAARLGDALDRACR
jgi:ribonuclease P protein component